MLKRIIVSALIALFIFTLPTKAQTDSIFTFRFPSKSDMLYIPWNGNGVVMDSLLEVISRNRIAIDEGKVYLSVSSYAAPNRKVGFTRNLRVKSALIIHAGLKENNFVTDRVFTTSDPLGQKNTVTVVLPASVEKVSAVAGTEAAARVQEYQQEVIYNSPQAKLARKAAEQRAAEQQERARKLAESEAQNVLQQERAVATDTVPEATPIIVRPLPEVSYGLSLRGNLLSWATLTPDLGVEWRINHRLGVLLNGSWTSWSWDNANRRYALWRVSPELRYYMGREGRGYLGAMYHMGEFNYKLDESGKQGDYQGGGITGGYQLPLNRSLSIDFHAGVGYTYAEYDKYQLIEGTKVRQGSHTKNYWGINQLGVTLVWKIIK